MLPHCSSNYDDLIHWNDNEYEHHRHQHYDECYQHQYNSQQYHSYTTNSPFRLLHEEDEEDDYFENFENLNHHHSSNLILNHHNHHYTNSAGIGRGVSPVTGGSGGGVQNCPECGKSFTNKSALAKHRLIHSNERKYSCHLCDKSFKRQDHLNGHLQTHQERKPFVCKAPGCDKSYCDSRSLKRHVESQHQDYLALLANGNSEALNFLPSIGKLKANLAPNLQQEIIVQRDETTSGGMISGAVDSNDCMIAGSSIVPVLLNVAAAVDEKIGPGSNQKAKNFFTFEEPKPEKCKICGKGFKNIPALNGHMRLHGGFLKQVLKAILFPLKSFVSSKHGYLLSNYFV